MIVLIIMSGFFVYSRLQTSLFPEITFPKIKIIADAGLQLVDKMMVTVTKPFDSQVQGVAEVRIIGGKMKEYWLTLDPQKMGTLGITPDMLSNALAQTNFIQSNGYLSDYRLLYLTVTDATVHSLEDLQKLIIINNGKRIVQLKDIGQVTIKEGVEYTKINANGKEGLLVAIIKQPNTNL